MSKTVGMAKTLEILTARQVADLCGVTRRTVSRWIEAGRLTPLMRLGDGPTNQLVFSREDVERLLEGGAS